MNGRRLISAVAGLLVVATATNGYAQDSVPELEDLVGLRGRSGESLLQERGYEYRWTEGSTGQCVEVITENGRYQEIYYVEWYHCD